MQIAETIVLTAGERERIWELWNNEYPEKLKHRAVSDLDDYLSSLENIQHLLLVKNNKIKGWAFAFQRNSENWFAIIVDSEIKSQGYGRMLLNKLKETAVELNGWVIDHNHDKKSNGETYMSPLEFYLKNNFLVLPDKLNTEKISAIKIRWKK